MINLAIGYLAFCVLSLAVFVRGILNAQPMPRQNLDGYSSEQKPDRDTRALRKHRTWANAELHRIYAKAEEQYD